MYEVDLVLTEAALRDCGLRRDAHGLAGVVKLGKEPVESIERPKREDFPAKAAFPGTG